MILRMRYLFTHEDTGRTYLTKGYYENGREAVTSELEDFAFPGGSFSWREVDDKELAELLECEN